MTEVPASCWWWTALALYLFVSWFIVGPAFSRYAYSRRNDLNSFWCGSPVELVWFCAPLYWPVALIVWALKRPLSWLIYGSTK